MSHLQENTEHGFFCLVFLAVDLFHLAKAWLGSDEYSFVF